MAIPALIISANICLLMILLLVASAPGAAFGQWVETGLASGAVLLVFLAGVYFSLRARAAGAKTRAAVIAAGPALFSIALFAILVAAGR